MSTDVNEEDIDHVETDSDSDSNSNSNSDSNSNSNSNSDTEEEPELILPEEPEEPNLHKVPDLGDIAFRWKTRGTYDEEAWELFKDLDSYLKRRQRMMLDKIKVALDSTPKKLKIIRARIKRNKRNIRIQKARLIRTLSHVFESYESNPDVYFKSDDFIIKKKGNRYDLTEALKYLITKDVFCRPLSDNFKYKTKQNLFDSIVSYHKHIPITKVPDWLVRKFILMLVNHFPEIVYDYADMIDDDELKILIWHNQYTLRLFREGVDVAKVVFRPNKKWVLTKKSGIARKHCYLILLGIRLDRHLGIERPLIKLGKSETWETPRVLDHMNGDQFPTAVQLYMYDTGDPMELEKSCQHYLEQDYYNYKGSNETYYLSDFQGLHKFIQNTIYDEERSVVKRLLWDATMDKWKAECEVATGKQEILIANQAVEEQKNTRREMVQENKPTKAWKDMTEEEKEESHNNHMDLIDGLEMLDGVNDENTND